MKEFTMDLKKDTDSVTGHPIFRWQGVLKFGEDKTTVYGKTMKDVHEKAEAWLDQKAI